MMLPATPLRPLMVVPWAFRSSTPLAAEGHGAGHAGGGVAQLQRAAGDGGDAAVGVRRGQDERTEPVFVRLPMPLMLPLRVKESVGLVVVNKVSRRGQHQRGGYRVVAAVNVNQTFARHPIRRGQRNSLPGAAGDYVVAAARVVEVDFLNRWPRRPASLCRRSCRRQTGDVVGVLRQARRRSNWPGCSTASFHRRSPRC